MQTHLADFIRGTARGDRADAILRSCVHCGFCTATCPTYQLLGDELDSPRGRIYLIKQVLEGTKATARTQTHLDRCLTCRSCETTCPSGVRYGELVDIGREVVEEQVPRSAWSRASRVLLRQVFTSPSLFRAAFGLGRAVLPLLPKTIQQQLAAPRPAGPLPNTAHRRHVVMPRGCVQSVLAPRINAAAARVLDRLGISVLETAGTTCCGAIDQHMSASQAALMHAKANVDAWCKALDEGAEAIVMTASGCGTTVKEYGLLLANDTAYSEKADRVASQTLDLSQLIAKEPLKPLAEAGPGGLNDLRCAYHPPCSLQHGQQLRGDVESILTTLGVTLLPIADAHLCCGSAGTYSIFQTELAERLKTNKLANLNAGEPSMILTANIGCMHHLQTGTQRRVHHWIEAVDDAMNLTYCDRNEPEHSAEMARPGAQ
ncbi:MAG: glycolate oxidase subunit GlcF [Chromatiales bacterium]|nr:glycolate oxidase subunit GlcF [Chromatiales bacterium]